MSFSGKKKQRRNTENPEIQPNIFAVAATASGCRLRRWQGKIKTAYRITFGQLSSNPDGLSHIICAFIFTTTSSPLAVGLRAMADGCLSFSHTHTLSSIAKMNNENQRIRCQVVTERVQSGIF